MSGKKGRSGRKGWRYEFDAVQMINTSAQILDGAMTAAKTPVTPSEKQRQHIATEVFKKLSPTKVEGNLKMSGIIVSFSDGTKVEM